MQSFTIFFVSLGLFGVDEVHLRSFFPSLKLRCSATKGFFVVDILVTRAMRNFGEQSSLVYSPVRLYEGVKSCHSQKTLFEHPNRISCPALMRRNFVQTLDSRSLFL